MKELEWLSWVAAGILLAGELVMIYKKKWYAFCVFFAGNLIYLYYWIVRSEWATVLLVATFMSQNILGIIKWRKDDRNQRKA